MRRAHKRQIKNDLRAKACEMGNHVHASHQKQRRSYTETAHTGAQNLCHGFIGLFCVVDIKVHNHIVHNRTFLCHATSREKDKTL